MKTVFFTVLSLLVATAAFSQNWSLSGNANPAANQFLGTTTNHDLRIRTNNLQRMVVTGGGRVGIGTATPSYALHVLTGSETRAGYFSNTFNSALGTYGLYAETNNPAANATERAAHLYAQGANGYNYGLWSEARNGATNYGVYARGVSAAGTNAYALYSQVSGGGNNYAGYFTGGRVYMSYRLGIMDETPDYPLDFGASYGDKVSFYTPNHLQNWHFGIGVQAGLMQIHTDGIQSDIAFGIGRSGQFTEKMRLKGGGQLLINTTETPFDYLLCVNGKAIFEEATVQLEEDWPDYVFAPGYPLRPLPELEQYVRENRHLPGIPTAAELKADGLELGEMNRRLTEKVEELTLYIIELEKRLQALEADRK